MMRRNEHTLSMTELEAAVGGAQGGTGAYQDGSVGFNLGLGVAESLGLVSHDLVMSATGHPASPPIDNGSGGGAGYGNSGAGDPGSYAMDRQQSPESPDPSHNELDGTAGPHFSGNDYYSGNDDVPE